MRIKTLPDLSLFLRKVTANANHHAHYALPIMPSLLWAVLMYVDAESLSTIMSRSGGPGNQLRFTFRGVPFKIKHTGRIDQTVVLKRVFGASHGPTLETFTSTDDTATIATRLHAALIQATSHTAAA